MEISYRLIEIGENLVRGQLPQDANQLDPIGGRIPGSHGDGIIHAVWGEVCDFGSENELSPCSAECTIRTP